MFIELTGMDGGKMLIDPDRIVVADGNETNSRLSMESGALIAVQESYGQVRDLLIGHCGGVTIGRYLDDHEGGTE